MHHVHTRTVTSNVTTKEPVAALSPAVLFPFFQAPTTASPTTSSASASPASPSPASSSSPPVSSSAVGSTVSTSTTDDSSCPCHCLDSLPASDIGPSSFITLPSANSHQPLVLPLPQPPAPPLVSSPAPAAFASSDSDTNTQSATASPSQQPLMVFSHGTTQVDTFVPSLRRLQHTLYSWSQLSDYTPKRCWELPATSSDTSQSSEAEGQEGAHNMSICKTVGRICQEDDVPRCPGHPWVSFSYHMQVRQWQEEVGAEGTSTTEAAAAGSEQSGQPCSAPESELSPGASGVTVQLSSPSGALHHRRRRSRSLLQLHSGHDSSTDNKDAGINLQLFREAADNYRTPTGSEDEYDASGSSMDESALADMKL